MATMPYTPDGEDNVKAVILTKLKGNDDYTEDQLTANATAIVGHTHGGTGDDSGAFYIVTSSTRPTVTTEGILIYETDTTNWYTWDGTNDLWRICLFNQYAGDPITLTLDTIYTAETGMIVADTSDMGALWTWNGTNWYMSWSGDIARAGATGVTYMLRLKDGHLIDLGPTITAGATGYLKENGTWSNPVPAALGTAYQKLQVNSGATASEWGLSPVAFCVNTPGTQTNITHSDTTIITFDTERFDVGGNFASSTFTAPVTGKYQINVHLVCTTMDVGQAVWYTRIVTSNKTYESRYDADQELNADGDVSISFSVVADMDAEDTVYIAVALGVGASETDIGAGGVFSGHLVA